MNGYEAYVLYLAIKRHFSPGLYDAFKYNFKVNVKPSSFESRSDRWQFEKLAKRGDDLKNFLVASFVRYGTAVWVGELNANPMYEKNFRGWQKRVQGLGYETEKDLKKHGGSLETILTPVGDNQHAPVFQLYLQKVVALETLVVLLTLVPGLMDRWKRPGDPLWDEFVEMYRKYAPFVRFDVPAMRQKIWKAFADPIINIGTETTNTDTQETKSNG